MGIEVLCLLVHGAKESLVWQQVRLSIDNIFATVETAEEAM